MIECSLIGKWSHIDGRSELVVEYIRALEQATWEN